MEKNSKVTEIFKRESERLKSISDEKLEDFLRNNSEDSKDSEKEKKEDN